MKHEKNSRRVSACSKAKSEKVITRHILEQTRRNSDDLAAIKTRLDRVERKVDVMDAKLDGLARNLPGIVADAVRAALPRRGKK